MIWDEDQPRKPPEYRLGADLSKFSIEELEDYSHILEAENKRVESAISSKKSSMDAAHSVFKR
jgi:uncharacterized small protein (DUF1192 family)